MLRELHFSTAMKAFSLSILLAIFSFAVGSKLIQTNININDNNPSSLLINELEENHPLLVYVQISSGTIVNIHTPNGIITSFESNPIFVYDIYEFNLAKVAPNTTGLDLYPNDLNFETNRWMFNPIPCCEFPVEKKQINDINTYIDTLETSLINDLDRIKIFSNITANTNIEQEVVVNNTGGDYFQVVHLYKNGLSILIEGFGLDMIVSFKYFTSVQVLENGYQITYEPIDSIKYFGQFENVIFENYKDGIDQVLEAILGE